MKKKTIIAYLLIFALFLSACGNNPTPPETESPTEDTPSPTQEPTTDPTDNNLPDPTEPTELPDAPPDPVEPEVSVQTQSAIDTAMGHAIDLNGSNYRYYGSYNGYIILCEMIAGRETIPLSIGDYTFADSTDSVALYAIADGRTTKLGYVYESGGITSEQLEQIYTIHTSYYWRSEYNKLNLLYQWYRHDRVYTHPNEQQLTHTIETAIDAAFTAVKGRHLRIDWVSNRYYGRVAGYHIVLEETGTVAEPQKVGPFTFHHHSGHVIWVVKNEEIYTLQDAYAQGLFTIYELEQIYVTHRSYYPEIYASWEEEDTANNQIFLEHADGIYGAWRSQYYFSLEVGPSYITASNELCENSFLADGRGSYRPITNVSPTYAMTWSLVGVTEESLVLLALKSDQDLQFFYYIIDPEHEYYQRLIYWEPEQDCYVICKILTDATGVTVPNETQLWMANASFVLGHWVPADIEYSCDSPPEDLELYFNSDGTGYKIVYGEKRVFLWRYKRTAEKVWVEMEFLDDSSTNSAYYDLNPNSEHYQKLYHSSVYCEDIIFERRSEYKEPVESAKPDGSATFNGTAADIVGIWVADHLLYDGQVIAAEPLELHFQAGGNGYVVQDGVKHRAAWNQTATDANYLTFEIMWMNSSVGGDIYYVYTLQYSLKGNSTHQLLHQITDSCTCVLTKVSNLVEAEDDVGNIGITITPIAAQKIALDYLGITDGMDDLWESTYQYSDGQYYLVIRYEENIYDFYINATDGSILQMVVHPSGSSTVNQIRQSILDHLGCDMNDVYYYFAKPCLTGQNRTIFVGCGGKQYEFTLDPDGRFLECKVVRVHNVGDEGKENVVGWRAARDICMEYTDRCMDDITYISISYLVADHFLPRYEVHLALGETILVDAATGLIIINDL